MKRGFAMVTVAVNLPTSTPPDPVNVKVPPDDGIPPAPRIAPYSPLIPSCSGSATGGPVGPVRVSEPASRPVTVSGPPAIIGYTEHPPGERIPLRPTAPARSPLILSKPPPALLVTVRI